MTEIVKVQRPMMTNDPDAPWLLYDKNRKYEEQLPDRLVPASVKKAMGRDYKGYFTGTWSSIVGWGLSERVSDKSW